MEIQIVTSTNSHALFVLMLMLRAGIKNQSTKFAFFSYFCLSFVAPPFIMKKEKKRKQLQFELKSIKKSNKAVCAPKIFFWLVLFFFTSFGPDVNTANFMFHVVNKIKYN